MKDVGLATATLEPQDHLYEAGHLSHQFGSVSETAQILSIEHLLRAEHNLGHAIDHVDNIDVMHIGRTDDEQDHRDDKIYQYSVRDTDAEKVGSDSDNDLATAGGHLKLGIQDTNSHENNKKRQNSLARLIQHLTEQELYDARINALVKNIEQLNKDIKEIDEAVDLIDHGNLDESTLEGRQNIKRIRSTMQAHGMDADDPKYQRPDGSFNAEQARQDLIEAREQKVEQRQEQTEELGQAMQERQMEMSVRQARAMNSSEGTDASLASSGNDIAQDSLVASIVQDSNEHDNVVQFAAVDEEPMMLDDVFGDMFEDEDNSLDAFAEAAPLSSQEEQSFDEARTATSFASLEDGEPTNTISATFAQASSPDAAPAPTTPDATQDPDVIYTAEVSNNNNTMSI